MYMICCFRLFPVSSHHVSGLCTGGISGVSLYLQLFYAKCVLCFRWPWCAMQPVDLSIWWWYFDRRERNISCSPWMMTVPSHWTKYVQHF